MTELKKKALITGATGFVGSHLARRLVNDGWDVHIIVRPSSKLEQLREAKDKVIVHRHDGTTEGMLAIMQEAQPEIVFHLASLFISEHQPKDVVPLIHSNLLFGTQLLEAMKAAKIDRLINTGTSWQHYQNEEYNPVNLYAATKQAFEDIIRYYIETSPLKIITLKLFDTYGPDDPRPKLFALLKKLAKDKRPLAMSPGEQLIDLVYIDDVVEAFIIAANRLLSGEVANHEIYAVSSGSLVELRELVGMFEECAGRKLKINWGGRQYRKREVMKPWSSYKTLPRWKPKVSLKDGISGIIQ